MGEILLRDSGFGEIFLLFFLAINDRLTPCTSIAVIESDPPWELPRIGDICLPVKGKSVQITQVSCGARPLKGAARAMVTALNKFLELLPAPRPHVYEWRGTYADGEWDNFCSGREILSLNKKSKELGKLYHQRGAAHLAQSPIYQAWRKAAGQTDFGLPCGVNWDVGATRRVMVLLERDARDLNQFKAAQMAELVPLLFRWANKIYDNENSGEPGSTGRYLVIYHGKAGPNDSALKELREKLESSAIAFAQTESWDSRTPLNKGLRFVASQINKLLGPLLDRSTSAEFQAIVQSLLSRPGAELSGLNAIFREYHLFQTICEKYDVTPDNILCVSSRGSQLEATISMGVRTLELSDKGQRGHRRLAGYHGDAGVFVPGRVQVHRPYFVHVSEQDLADVYAVDGNGRLSDELKQTPSYSLPTPLPECWARRYSEKFHAARLSTFSTTEKLTYIP